MWALLGAIIAIGWTISGSFSANASQIQPLRPVAGAPPTQKDVATTMTQTTAGGLTRIIATSSLLINDTIRTIGTTPAKKTVGALMYKVIKTDPVTMSATARGAPTKATTFNITSGVNKTTTYSAIRDGTATVASSFANPAFNATAIRGAPQVDVTIGSPAPSFISKISAIMTAIRDRAASALFFGFTLFLSVTAVTMLTRRRSSLKGVNTHAAMRLWDVDLKRHFGLPALST